jgi:hypothetical protein
MIALHVPEEQLRCNICGTTVGTSKAKEHASTSSHTLLKAKLEESLKAVRKEQYSNDRSVILQWSSSV